MVLYIHPHDPVGAQQGHPGARVGPPAEGGGGSGHSNTKGSGQVGPTFPEEGTPVFGDRPTTVPVIKASAAGFLQ